MCGLIEKSIKSGQTLPVLVNNHNNNNSIRIGCYTGKRRLIGIRECRIKPGNTYYINV